MVVRVLSDECSKFLRLPILGGVGIPLFFHVVFLAKGHEQNSNVQIVDEALDFEHSRVGASVIIRYGQQSDGGGMLLI